LLAKYGGRGRNLDSDQGSQFTSADFLDPLKQRSISISIDGRGRALDSAFIERLWRSLKYELINPEEFDGRAELGFSLWAKPTMALSSSSRSKPKSCR
jgi:putative transposase